MNTEYYRGTANIYDLGVQGMLLLWIIFVLATLAFALAAFAFARPAAGGTLAARNAAQFPEANRNCRRQGQSLCLLLLLHALAAFLASACHPCCTQNSDSRRELLLAQL